MASDETDAPVGSPRQRLAEIAKQADIVMEYLDARGDPAAAAEAAEILETAEALRAHLVDDDAEKPDIQTLLSREVSNGE